jgi:hypothetical protein
MRVQWGLDLLSCGEEREGILTSCVYLLNVPWRRDKHHIVVWSLDLERCSTGLHMY